MTRKKTDAEFKKEVYDLVGNEYNFLDPYIKSSVKIKVKHNKCGNVYEVKPNNFLNGKRCPYCTNAVKTKTDAQFKKEVFDLVGNEYTFLDSYVNQRTKIKVKHNKCGNIYEVMPNSFLTGNRCPYCAKLGIKNKLRKTDAEFKMEVYDLVGNEYTFLDTYVNSRTKIRVKHNRCGTVYKVKPSMFLSGSRCPSCCTDCKKKTNIQFQHEVNSLVNNEYTFLEPYVSSRTKIKVKHNKCGNVYEVRPTDFISHIARCPYCNMPKTEKTIAMILDMLNISYEIQKTFDDLKDLNLLSYDFYIPDQAVLIEYQGRQHYQSVDVFGGDDKFKLQQKHDKMKADYAKEHHYHLIAIPYTKDTFSKIKKYLLSHGLSK